jgi:6-phosphofructokinase
MSNYNILPCPRTTQYLGYHQLNELSQMIPARLRSPKNGRDVRYRDVAADGLGKRHRGIIPVAFARSLARALGYKVHSTENTSSLAPVTVRSQEMSYQLRQQHSTLCRFSTRGRKLDHPLRHAVLQQSKQALSICYKDCSPITKQLWPRPISPVYA